jgi:hypothetical protein
MQQFIMDFTVSIPTGRDDRSELALGLASTTASRVAFDQIERRALR